MKIYLETERLYLREMIMEDAPGILEMDSDPEVQKYLGNHIISTSAEAAKIIIHIRNQYKNNGIGRWTVVLKSNHEILGWAGLKKENQLRPDRTYYDLGYRFLKKHWGKGYATEAAKASVEYGFKEMNLKEINACADVRHIVSNKILSDKLGMTFLETFMYDNALHNWYSITR